MQPVHPTLDSPEDLTYDEGTIGHEITWNATASFPLYYVVYRNGTLIESNEWNGSQIVLSVDSLSVGTYEYALTVEDTFGGSASDTVRVTVTAVPATAPPTDFDWVLIAAAAGTFVVLLAAICILFSRRT